MALSSFRIVSIATLAISPLLGCGGAFVADLPASDGGDASIADAADASVSADSGGDAGENVEAGEACTSGGECIPSVCGFGHFECIGGGAQCTRTGDVADGTPCSEGPGKVCHQGQCIACSTGADCTAPNSCQKMTYDCSSGLPVCAPTGNVANGTPCGANAFCNGGTCAACTAGADCAPPDKPCNTGAIVCAEGSATCSDLGTPAPNGRACGTNAVCDQGACTPCAANLTCTPSAPQNVCDKGLTDCSTGLQACQDAHMPDPAQDAKPCATNLICSGGACVACGPTSCPNGCCDAAGQCVTAVSPKSCGAKGGRCITCGSLPNVAGPTSCVAGQCSVPATSCNRGWAHCSANPNDGCEADLTKPANCGRCKNACASASACCIEVCSDTRSDEKNCGACGNACLARETCLRSKCTCTMVGYWPADGNALDIVGGNDGQVAGATFGGGESGQAFAFDAMSSISVLRPPVLRTDGDWTYSLWINVRAYSNGSLSSGDGSYFVDRTSATNPLISLKAIGDMFAFQVRYDDGTGLGGPVGGAIRPNVLTHVAMVRRAGSVFALYVGGQLVGSVVDSGAPLTAPAFKLGRHESLLGFAGQIDELRIYDYGLTPGQIQELASGQECR